MSEIRWPRPPVPTCETPAAGRGKHTPAPERFGAPFFHLEGHAGSELTGRSSHGETPLPPLAYPVFWSFSRTEVRS